MIPVRVQRSRAKGVHQPDNCRYCGRGTLYGNNYRVGWVDGTDCYCVYNLINGYESHYMYGAPSANEHALELFARDFEKSALHDPGRIARVKQDLGRYKFLSCFCPLDMPCHVDTLIELFKAAA